MFKVNLFAVFLSRENCFLQTVCKFIRNIILQKIFVILAISVAYANAFGILEMFSRFLGLFFGNSYDRDVEYGSGQGGFGGFLGGGQRYPYGPSGFGGYGGYGYGYGYGYSRDNGKKSFILK